MPEPTDTREPRINLKTSWEYLTSKKFVPVLQSIMTLTLLVGFLLAFRFVFAMIANGSGPDVGDAVLAEYLLQLLFAGVFPLTAVAYGLFQSGSQEAELRKDLEFLAIEQTSDTGTGTGTDIMRRFKASYSQWNYAFQYALPMLTTALGLSLFLLPSSRLSTEFIDPLAVTAMSYGFLGAYIYSIQYIYRRYTTLDLQPSVFMHCGVVLLAGIVFNYVAFNFVGQAVAGGSAARDMTPVEGGLQAIVAFSLGYFPALAIRWFSRVAYGALGVKQRRSDFLPLSLIDGISQFHESRLRDEGIDNIQNLASSKIDELLMHTPFGLQQIIEWIDQSILYMYLEPSEIESFRRGGVRSITDFQAHWEYFSKPGRSIEDVLTDDQNPQDTRKQQQDDKWKARRATRAQQLQSTTERLDALYDTTKFGPNMAHVSFYWKATGMVSEDFLDSRLEIRRMELAAQVEQRREILSLQKAQRDPEPRRHLVEENPEAPPDSAQVDES